MLNRIQKLEAKNRIREKEVHTNLTKVKGLNKVGGERNNEES